VSFALPPEAAAFLALLALALLPGLVVVRAPWTVVPALSTAFWTLSWWWLPLAGRARALQLALVGFSVLAALRLLPRHQVSPPPEYQGPAPPPLVRGPLTGHAPTWRSVPSLVVTVVALALAWPFPLWPHAPGAEWAFHTTSARLLVWRDAVPATYEPLLPIGPFGAHAPAVATLSADVALLSGLDAGRAVVVVAHLSVGVLLLGSFALVATRSKPATAMLAVLLALAAAPWPGFLALWGEGGPTLALALGVSAATLLVGHGSRPSAVAAGLLLGAALLAQPVLTLGLGLAVAAWSGREGRGRLGLSAGVAAVLAGPGLFRLGQALSMGELVTASRTITATELLRFVTGLGLIALGIVVAHRLSSSHPRMRVLAGALVAVSTLVLLVRMDLGPASGQLPPAARRALAGLAKQGRPMDAVCAPVGLIEWVPALAGRPPGVTEPGMPGPWIPPLLREEWDRAPRRGCSMELDPEAKSRSHPLTSP
jgi:hypothetical protein